MTLQTTKQESKNGGPYTKQEQEKRRNKVYELYFDKGFSAIKISEELDVNRNTVNSDIKLLLSQTSYHLGKEKLAEVVLKQLERLEIQRRRVMDFLDPNDFEKSIKTEKILLEIDEKIGSLVSRLGNSFELDRFSVIEEISEKDIAKFLRDIVPLEFPCTLSKTVLLEKLISYQKCDLEHAKNILEKMKSVGLELTNVGGSGSNYCLSRFAVMRGYISKKYNEKMKEKLDKELEKEFEEEEKQIEKLEKESSKQYGSDKSKWPKSILDELDNLYGW